MPFEWDEAKRRMNLQKHGIDFLRAAEVFESDYFVVPSNRNGEKRWKAVGKAQSEIFAVIFTVRGEKMRIISARKGRKDEKTRYRYLYE